MGNLESLLTSISTFFSKFLRNVTLYPKGMTSLFVNPYHWGSRTYELRSRAVRNVSVIIVDVWFEYCLHTHTFSPCFSTCNVCFIIFWEENWSTCEPLVGMTPLKFYNCYASTLSFLPGSWLLRSTSMKRVNLGHLSASCNNQCTFVFAW